MRSPCEVMVSCKHVKDNRFIRQKRSREVDKEVTKWKFEIGAQY